MNESMFDSLYDCTPSSLSNCFGIAHRCYEQYGNTRVSTTIWGKLTTNQTAKEILQTIKQYLLEQYIYPTNVL